MEKVKLFIIDPQVDFCDKNGKLSVPGAEEDMKRVAKMIVDNLNAIGDINITLDSHNNIHIAHPIWWINSEGNHPDPFTLISVKDVEEGKWRAFNPGFQQRSLDYVKALEANGRYLLCIWPPHCLIGTPGHNVVPELLDALDQWEAKFRLVNKVTKGSNIFTEHYSAVKADVEDPNDRTTMLNEKLVNALKDGDEDILIAGEALSHCVASTIRDVANEFSDEQVKRFVLLKDACSNVPSFENLGEDFVKEMTAKGMKVSTTDKYFA
jgi:nicotinamidase/pyrazinamidase